MITVDNLTQAIENSIDDGNGLSREEAYDLAQHVLNFFGYSERIIDNVLEPEDRDAFYMMEDVGILFTEREEITLYDGREWRIHYWLFNRGRINYLMEKKPKSFKKVDDSESVYRTEVTDDMWASRKKSDE